MFEQVLSKVKNFQTINWNWKLPLLLDGFWIFSVYLTTDLEMRMNYALTCVQFLIPQTEYGVRLRMILKVLLKKHDSQWRTKERCPFHQHFLKHSRIRFHHSLKIVHIQVLELKFYYCWYLAECNIWTILKNALMNTTDWKSWKNYLSSTLLNV